MSRNSSRSTTILPYLFIFSSFILIQGEFSFAEESVYKWTDKNGKVHFSTTKPKKNNAAPANLPQIKKVDMDQQIKRIKETTPRNCSARGGVDCESGPDKDGSVICLDGFKDSVLPFESKCGQAKLQVDSAKFSEDFSYLEVIIRNLSPVSAEGIQVLGRLKAKPRRRGVGPLKVEAYSVGEYKIPLETSVQRIAPSLRVYSYKIRCDNCSSKIQRQLKIR